jgi:hypothetical protein
MHALHDNRWMTTAQLETIGVALDPMLLPDEPFRKNATALLAAALGATTSDRIAAANVVIEAMATRRLDATKLGKAIATAMRQPDAVPDRWASALAPVAAVSPRHAKDLQHIVETTLGELGAARPKLPKFVDLLRTVAQTTETAITNDQARRWLLQAPPQSKLGRAATATLAVGEHG